MLVIQDMKNRGLSVSEAQIRLQKNGYNEITTTGVNGVLEQIKKIFLDPMGMMLLGLSILYWFLGDKTDSIILAVAFFPVTAIDVILDIQSSKALQALKSAFSPTVKVYRDNQIVTLPTREIVDGDVIVFEEGQSLPADGKLIEAESISINEALLTGESLPVAKNINDLFFAGTTVLSGSALGLVQQTGGKTRFGKIAELTLEASESQSPLRKTIDHLVRVAVIVAAVFVVVLFFIEMYRTQAFIPSLISALTLGMAAIPEEFPLVFTLYLSFGAWRLSKKGVLVKSLPSVEALGRVDIICTDKTGTLTEGLFQFEEIKPIEISESQELIWQLALMACEVHPVDSMEVALFKKAGDFKNQLNNWELIHDYQFEYPGKHMTHVWKNKLTGEERLAMKGASEGVLEHCDVTAEQRKIILKLIEETAGQGKRVLGLSSRSGPFTGVRVEDERKLTFMGLIVFSDPVRSTVKQAIHDCQAAGIQVKMLTGDHLLTAHAVANEIGLQHTHEGLFTGDQLSLMTDSERVKAYKEGSLFARVLPEQKYEMVKALKASGHIVAMTGDGINDSPALKLADIGISMGATATDVARSTAKIVLMKNDFSGIVSAVFEGRRIFANLRRSFSYLIAFHVPVILLALIPAIFGWPTLLMPIHIILLELVVHPVSAYTFENIETPDLAKQQQKSILDRTQFLRALFSGLILSVVSLFCFQMKMIESIELARTFAFAVILLGNIFLVTIELPIVSWNRRFYITIAGLIIATWFLTVSPIMQEYLHFNVLTATDLIKAFLYSLVVFVPKFVLKK